MNNHQIQLIKNYYQKEADKIEAKWDQIVNQFKIINDPFKLVIVGEAPLSFDKYFYNKPAGFLNGLKNHYSVKLNRKLTNEDFISVLNYNGIILLDIFKYPLPSNIFANNFTDFIDTTYIENKMYSLKPLLNNQTKFIFRYKMLIDRGLHNLPPFNPYQNSFIKDGQNVVSLFSQERPIQTIRNCVVDHLPLK